jgi:hypothetical protein
MTTRAVVDVSSCSINANLSWSGIPHHRYRLGLLRGQIFPRERRAYVCVNGELSTPVVVSTPWGRAVDRIARGRSYREVESCQPPVSQLIVDRRWPPRTYLLLTSHRFFGGHYLKHRPCRFRSICTLSWRNRNTFFLPRVFDEFPLTFPSFLSVRFTDRSPPKSPFTARVRQNRVVKAHAIQTRSKER